MYIYVTNESALDLDVFFDDLKVSHTQSEILQEDHYYPFGLTLGGLGKTGNNPFKYNGKEEQDELNLGWVDYGARQYDAALARFTSIDPAADEYLDLSPYSYVANNPLLFIDPDGRNIVVGVQESDKDRKDELEQKFKDVVGNAFRNRVSANVDENGKVAFSRNKDENGNELALTENEQEAFDALNDIATDQETTINHTLLDSDSEGSSGVLVGRFEDGALDLDDAAVFDKSENSLSTNSLGTNREDRITTASVLVHESTEQFEKAKGTRKGTAHRRGIRAANKTRNFQRNPRAINFTNFNGTLGRKRVRVRLRLKDKQLNRVDYIRL